MSQRRASDVIPQRWFVAVACLVQQTTAMAHSQRTTFSGTLESLSSGRMSLQLADGVSIGVLLFPSGDLSAEAIVQRYKFADHVTIACRPIGEPAYDNPGGRLLQLKKVRYLRPASAEPESAHPIRSASLSATF